MSEKDGVRSLHLGSSTVQSAMRISDPIELVLSYTQAMMGFLLFTPEPARVAMIGLGGGSLPKFVRHHMPTTRIIVVESNPRVISAARSFFEVPEDDQYFSIVLGQGEQWIADQAREENVLMVDDFTITGGSGLGIFAINAANGLITLVERFAPRVIEIVVEAAQA